MNKINFIKTENSITLINNLREESFVILNLDTRDTLSIDIFYKRLIKCIPIGIPLSGDLHWDAFLDSAFEGIANQSMKKIALIWYGAENIIDEKLSDFAIIIDILSYLSVTLNEYDGGTQFITFVIGDTGNFR